MKPWRRVDPTTVKKVGWRTIVVKNFIAPDGHTQSYALFNRENTRCAGTVALTPERKVIVARQFRPGPEKVMDEIPGGGVDAEEAPEAAAIRELEEETGYRPGTVKFLGEVYKDAYNNTTWYYYLATDCVPSAGGQHLDEGEHVEPALLSIDEFLAGAREGRMTDVEAVFLAYDELTRLAQGK